MNLLDRYIFKSVLFTCLAAMGLFAFVLMLGNAVKDLLGHALAGQLPLPVFAWLVCLLIPFVITYALPMGMLTGVLLTLGRLSSDAEVTAMRAAGMSLTRIARPVILLGLLGTLAGLYANFKSMPWSRVEYHRLLDAAIGANPLSFVQPRTYIREFRGCVVYIGEREGTVLRDIWFLKLDGERRVTHLTRADAGRINYDRSTNSLLFTLVNAKTEERNAEDPEDFTKSPIVVAVGRTEEMRLPLDRFFKPGGGSRSKPEWMTFTELQVLQAKLDARPPPAPGGEKQFAREAIQPALVIHEKANLSLAVLVFVLIGVPLGIKVSRRETSANLGVALFLVLGYYLLTVMVKWLDRHPEYRPDLLLWVPNLLFLGVALYLFRRIERA